MQVITWMSPSGAKIDVCRDCERRLGEHWPKDSRGQEYSEVSHGLHSGECDVHPRPLPIEVYVSTRGPWQPAALVDRPAGPVVIADGDDRPRGPGDVMGIRPMVSDENLPAADGILHRAVAAGFVVMGWTARRPERSESILDGPSDPAPDDSAITLPRNPLGGSCR